MTITINGNGTVTGVSVGGLPDGIVDADMIAADSVTAPKIGSKTFTSYAVICDQKSLGTDAGSFTTGDWRTRDLNTEITDADGIVSISSNQFTLQAGTYFIEASAPAYKVIRHMIKLRQTSGTPADIAFGTSVYAGSSVTLSNTSVLATRLTITGATTYEIQHDCTETSTTYGFGVGGDRGVEKYTVVKIYKEA